MPPVRFTALESASSRGTLFFPFATPVQHINGRSILGQDDGKADLSLASAKQACPSSTPSTSCTRKKR